jgi:hypothetical protein
MDRSIFMFEFWVLDEIQFIKKKKKKKQDYIVWDGNYSQQQYSKNTSFQCRKQDKKK